MSQPWYIDQFWRHFHGRGYDATSSGSATTLASLASEGDLSFTATSATGFVVGELVIVGSGTSWQSFTITGIAGAVISVNPKVKPGGYAAGVTFGHGWANDAHPGTTSAYQAIAAMMAVLLQKEVRAGRNRLGPLLGLLEATATDGRSTANVPVRWESLGTATFAATAYSTSDQRPAARFGNGIEIQASAIGDGMRSLIPLPVTPGERYVLQAQTRHLAGTGFQMQLVDAASPATVVGQLAEVVGGTSSQNYGVFARPSALLATVPAGVTALEVRFVSTGTTDKIGVDDVRLTPSRQLAGEDRFLFEDPWATQGIVWLGDSWGASIAPLFQTQLQTQLGHSVTVQNSSVSGNKLDDMIARFDADVRAYNPGYCVIQYGANDLSAAQSQATMETNMDTIIALCRSARIIPVILGLTPYTPAIAIAGPRNEAVRARVDVALFEPGWRNESGPPPPDKQ